MKVAFLSGMEDSVTRMLVSQFSQVLIAKDQFVCRYGEEGSDMYFVFTGVLEVLVPLETLRRKLSSEQKAMPTPTSFQDYFSDVDPKKPHTMSQMKKVNELTAGSYFGEVAMFTNKPRSAHTRSKTPCVLYKLSRRSLGLVFERYPDWKIKVHKIATIQQEQQHLRNLYMEEQQDVSAMAAAATEIQQLDCLEMSQQQSHHKLSFGHQGRHEGGAHDAAQARRVPARVRDDAAVHRGARRTVWPHRVAAQHELAVPGEPAVHGCGVVQTTGPDERCESRLECDGVCGGACQWVCD
ncbi:Voltage-gated ion channel, partial [Globisporangium splendens]